MREGAGHRTRRARTGRGVRLPPVRPSGRPAGPPQDEVAGQASGPLQGEISVRPAGPPVAPAAGLILVGRFGAPQGVRGALRVQSFTADPAAIAAYGALSDAAGARTFQLTDVRALKGAMLVAGVEGIADRDAAAALTGVDLYARRENLPPPDDDEVYVADLVGIVATTADGAAVGTIAGVLNHGAGDILEIAPESGGDTLLVPFTRAFVPDVDVAERRVVIVLPTDLTSD